MVKQSDDAVIEAYKQQADIILKRMYQILLRAQRKTEDTAYKKALNRMKGL